MESMEEPINEQIHEPEFGGIEDSPQLVTEKHPDIAINDMDEAATPSESNYKEQFSATKILLESNNSDPGSNSCQIDKDGIVILADGVNMLVHTCGIIDYIS